MNENQQKSIKDMIAKELGARAATTAPVSHFPAIPNPEAPAAEIKKEPTLPSRVGLDEYEALLVDAIKWRQDSVEKTVALLEEKMKECKAEQNKVQEMKKSLVNRCCDRLGINSKLFNIQINSSTKEIQIEKRGS